MQFMATAEHAQSRLACDGPASSRAADAPPIVHTNLLERDRLAVDAHNAVVRSGQGALIDLMNYAPLASQHHMSPYSLLKFGVLGMWRWRSH